MEPRTFLSSSVEDASWSLAVWTPDPLAASIQGSAKPRAPHGSLPCMNDSVPLGWNLGDPGSYLSEMEIVIPRVLLRLFPIIFQMGALYSAGVLACLQQAGREGGWQRVRLDPTFGKNSLPWNHCLTAALRLRKEEGVLHCFYLETSEKHRPRSQSEKLETSFRVPWDPGGLSLRIVLLGVSSGCQSTSNCFRAQAKNTVETHIPYIICLNTSSYKSGQWTGK